MRKTSGWLESGSKAFRRLSQVLVEAQVKRGRRRPAVPKVETKSPVGFGIGSFLIAGMRGRGDVGLSTDEILAITRGARRNRTIGSRKRRKGGNHV